MITLRFHRTTLRVSGLLLGVLLLGAGTADAQPQCGDERPLLAGIAEAQGAAIGGAPCDQGPRSHRLLIQGVAETPRAVIGSALDGIRSYWREEASVFAIGGVRLADQATAWASLLLTTALGLALVPLAWIIDSESRRSERYSCDLRVSLQLGGRTMQCSLMDVSQTGARLRVDSGLQGAETGVLAVGNLVFKVRIMWARGSYVGVQFCRPLPLSARKLAALSC